MKKDLAKLFASIISIIEVIPNGNQISKTILDLLRKLFGANGSEWQKALKNFLRQSPKGKGALILDCSPEFVPATFINKDWDFAKGEFDRDPRVSEMTTIDFSEVVFESLLGPKETVVTGEEKLKRHRQVQSIVPLGANAFQALWLDYQAKGENSILETLFKEKGITWMEFYGDILQSPGGGRFTLCLYRHGDGAWRWDYHWLGDGRGASGRSVVSLASI